MAVAVTIGCMPTAIPNGWRNDAPPMMALQRGRHAEPVRLRG
jgi:hypothetical protein